MRRFLLGFFFGAISILAVLIGVGHWLDLTDPLAKSDAIVAISGDTGARAETAIGLWKQGYAPLLIFSGGSSDPESVASAELMRRTAMAAGVPANAIVVEGTSATTEENAQRVAELMKGRGLRSAILVTSPYHQRRAAILFEREFGPASLSFRNHPADDPDWDASLWWTSEPSRSRTFVELAKLGALVAGQRPG
ncbi:MAG: YdcF family protein [Chloroflexi bacterium]|nr:MAG: YdcF family protein [Chloroflexota bacterium]